MEYMLKRNFTSKNTAAIIITGEDGETRYCCVDCTFQSKEKRKLESHLVVHNRGYRFVCGICGSGLKRREHFDRHTAEHQETRPHVCSECGKGFKRKEHLNIHFSLHIGNRNQECTICKKTFYRKDHLQKHLQTHSKVLLKKNLLLGGDRELVVKQEVMDEFLDNSDHEIKTEVHDNYENESNLDLSNNYLNGSFTLGTEERPFVCFVCRKTYKRRDHLKMHSLTHMKKDKVCSECGKAYHKEEQLLVHMNTHLNLYAKDAEDMNQLQSLLRDQSDLFSDEHNLLVPRMTIYKEENRPHECEICHRRFKRRQHLKVHMNVHLRHQANHETVWCSFCNQVFNANEEFENHSCNTNGGSISDHCDGENDDRELSMPLGAKKENKLPLEYVEVDMSGSEIKYTMGRDERQLPVPQRVYVCKYCTKPFKRKDHYKIHLHIHTGIKSFFCTDCGKGFYRKDHLQKHMQVHTKPKPKPKRSIPDLYPINAIPKKKNVKPEITIHAPSNAKLRLPLQIKVPYQMVLSTDDGEQHAVTINPDDDHSQEILS